MLNILVDTTIVRERLAVLGFSFVGVADSPDAEVDVNVYSEGLDYPVVADCTHVVYESARGVDDDIYYAMGEEYSEYLLQNIGRGFFVYYVYRQIEEVQYEDGVCKYSNPKSSIHVPHCTVYHPVMERFYSMCYCGTLEWLHQEQKSEIVPENDTVIVVRK